MICESLEKEGALSMNVVINASPPPPFPIGFWNYTFMDMRGVGPGCVRDWVDAGMTMAMSPEFIAGRDDPRAMLAILDAAAEAGIRVILYDRRGTCWQREAANDEAAYRRAFAQTLKDFGSHPAVSGFFVGDEPSVEALPAACKAYRIQKEMSPSHSPFLNMDCWHWDTDETVPDFPAHLDRYIELARPDVLAYDCYSQMKTSPGALEKYYRNLRDFQAAAARHNLPLWVTQLSVCHYDFRGPSDDGFRWQINTAVAHGATGLLWFFFYQRYPSDNYRSAPVDEHGERTETFHQLSRANRTFLEWHAPVMRDLVLKSVHHVGQSWAGFPALDGSGPIRSASAKQPLIVSFFADPQGRDYAAVVNNSPMESTQAEVVFAPGMEARYVNFRYSDEQYALWAQTDTAARRGRIPSAEAGSRIKLWLAPGQMELFAMGKGMT
jgi:hypothetical protein